MSRYSNINPLAAEVYARIQPHSSLRPIAQSAILGAFNRTTPPDAVHDALEQLIDARLISHMRHTREGVTQNVYWPTGLKPITAPSIEEISMSSEPKNSLLNRLILLHGPIAGAALAEKARATGANIPAKNVPGLLETLVRKGDVIVKKHDGASHYMTPNQAADWEENVAAAGGNRDKQAGAHVMSAAPVTKQSPAAHQDEKPANGEQDEREEAMPEPDAKLLAMANAMLSGRVEDLEASLSEALAYNRIAGDLLADLEELLDVEHRDELIPCIKAYLADVPAESTVSNPETVQPGRLALLLIDSADLTEIEELAAGCDIRIAQAVAMARIDQGHAARAVVVRIFGEAARSVEWKQAA